MCSKTEEGGEQAQGTASVSEFSPGPLHLHDAFTSQVAFSFKTPHIWEEKKMGDKMKAERE